MNSSKSSVSYSNFSSTDYDSISLEKLREQLENLEEHLRKSDSQSRFAEAELTKQRIEYMRKIEKDKILNQKKLTHEEEKLKLENQQKEELLKYNEQSDEKYLSLSKKYAELEKNLKDTQNNELNALIEKFHKEYPEAPKPSTELLNLNKILENLKKQKEYGNAHKVQGKIGEITALENKKFMEEKERKLKKEVEKIKIKHDNENLAFQLKMSAAFNEFKKSRATEYERLIQKFKNKFKDLDNLQKTEINTISKKKQPSINKSLANSNNTTSLSNLTGNKNDTKTISTDDFDKSNTEDKNNIITPENAKEEDTENKER